MRHISFPRKSYACWSGTYRGWQTRSLWSRYCRLHSAQLLLRERSYCDEHVSAHVTQETQIQTPPNVRCMLNVAPLAAGNVPINDVLPVCDATLHIGDDRPNGASKRRRIVGLYTASTQNDSSGGSTGHDGFWQWRLRLRLQTIHIAKQNNAKVHTYR